MNDSFFTNHQFKFFTEDLCEAFINAGFEVLEEPYIDYVLCGFRATYIRRYLLHQPTIHYNGIMTSLIYVVGLPIGQKGQKMIILSTPRDSKNEPISEAIKLRVQIDENGLTHVVHGESQGTAKCKEPIMQVFNPFTVKSNDNNESNNETSENRLYQPSRSMHQDAGRFRKIDINTLAYDLASYVSHLIEIISPGLIELPVEMKLEILKQLSVDSIIKMSQVNNEFKTLIFKRGESLWRHLCLRDFNIRSINRLVHKSWMELYRDTYVHHQYEICRKERALPGLPERPALPPVPDRLRIGWWPQALELPLYPIEEAVNHENNILALEFHHPMRRADSLDSFR